MTAKIITQKSNNMSGPLIRASLAISVTIPYNHALSFEENHKEAAKELRAKLKLVKHKGYEK